MLDERPEEIALDRKGELEHDLPRLRQGIEIGEDLVTKDRFAFLTIGRLDRILRLQDRHHVVAEHLVTEFELLRHGVGNALRIGGVYDRAFLGAERSEEHTSELQSREN